MQEDPRHRQIPRAREVFEVGGVLGRGGFGEVLAAVHRGSGQRVALKRAFGGEADRSRILREVQLLGRLRHPGLANLLGLFRGEGEELLLAYELVPGQPLASLPAPFGVDTLRWVVEQLAVCLDYLHGEKVLHRDLKPENVMIDSSGGVRLLDFGIARALDQGQTLTATGVLLGTPVYMAPELLRGEPPTPAVDLYALGVLVYWGLSGRHPFPGDDLAALARRTSGPPSLGGARARDLDPFLACALSPDPDRRPASGSAFREAFEGAWRAGTRGGPPLRRTPDPPSEITRLLPGTAVPGQATRALSGVGSAAPAPEGRPGSRSRGLLVAALVGVALVSLALPRGQGGDPPGQPLDPGSPGPEGAGPQSRAEPFPETLQSVGARTRGHLSDLAGLIVDRSGKVVPGAQVDADHFELTGGDPLVWPRLVARLPEYQAFLEWIASGGSPDQIPREVERDLERTDAFFARQKLPRPFVAFRGLRPLPEPAPLPPVFRVFRTRLGLDESFPDQVGGWLGTALAELQRCSEGLAEKSDDLRDDIQALPAEIRDLYRTRGGMLGGSLRKAVRGAFDLTTARRPVCRWVREETEWLQRGLLAAGLALREDPGLSPLVALILEDFFFKVPRFLLQTELFATPVEVLLGPPGEDAQAWNTLAYRILREQELAQRISPAWAEEARRTRARMDEVLAGVLAGGREGMRNPLWIGAQRKRVELAARDEQWELLPGILRECRSHPAQPAKLSDWLPASRETWKWIRRDVALGLLRSGSAHGLDAEEVRSLVVDAEDLEFLASRVGLPGSHIPFPVVDDEDDWTPEQVSAALERLARPGS